MKLCLLFMLIATTSYGMMQKESTKQDFLEKVALSNASFKELLCSYVPIELKVLQDNRQDPLKYNECFFTMKFSHDEKILAAARGKKVLIVDCVKERWLTIVSHYDEVCALCFRPDDHVLASATRNNIIRFWNCNSEKLFKCDTIGKDIESCKNIIEICFSADGKLIFGLQQGGKIYAWHVDDRLQAFVLRGYPEMYTIRRSVDDKYIEGLTSDVRCAWDMQGNQIASKNEKNTKKIAHIKLCNDTGVSLILENPLNDGVQCEQDAALRVCTQREYGTAKHVAMSDSGNKIAAICTGGILMWDLTLFNAIFKLAPKQREAIIAKVYQSYELFKESLVKDILSQQ